MCTAIAQAAAHPLFGRNLDLEYGYDECVTITPRGYALHLRCMPPLPRHYAMIGNATVSDGYPLYFEATNEVGLSMAGLNFPGNAVYSPVCGAGSALAPFEVIPWTLAQFRSAREAAQALSKCSIVSMAFSEAHPLSPLHWLLSDGAHSFAVEPMADGLHVSDDPFHVLTNNPPLAYQLYHLAEYRGVSSRPSEDRFAPSASIAPYSNGMGGLGLPGDYSSASRFVKAAFLRGNSVSRGVDADILHFFDMLAAVAMPRGSVILADGRAEVTRYSCCCDVAQGCYYYKTNESSRICAVSMQREDLERSDLICYPMERRAAFHPQN